MNSFTDKGSIARQIWGKSDTILFIFAGSAAEFALNKAVDWLYFTGRLPADPLGRLFSTVAYARKIVFSDMEAANLAIDRISSIHAAVEKNRAAKIPDWAYRDVLFMLIYYSIASFELLERKLSEDEKEDVFHVFYRVGNRMRLEGLPKNYSEWLQMRATHLQNDLVRSHYTDDLFAQYRKHLGSVRYTLLRQAQSLVAPARVNELLGLGHFSFLRPALVLYKLSRKLRAAWILKSLLLPPLYKAQIDALDIVPE